MDGWYMCLCQEKQVVLHKDPHFRMRLGQWGEGMMAVQQKECKQAALYAQLRWLGFGRHSDRLFCLILRGKYLQDQIRKVY